MSKPNQKLNAWNLKYIRSSAVSWSLVTAGVSQILCSSDVDVVSFILAVPSPRDKNSSISEFKIILYSGR